jgi:hypothetical protein
LWLARKNIFITYRDLAFGWSSILKGRTGSGSSKGEIQGVSLLRRAMKLRGSGRDDVRFG